MKAFLKTLLAAAVGGAISAVSDAALNGNTNFKQLGKSAGIGAIIAVGGLFAPVPTNKKTSPAVPLAEEAQAAKPEAKPE